MTKAKNPKVKLSIGDAFARVLNDEEQKQRDFEALYRSVIRVADEHDLAWLIGDARARALRSAVNKAAKWVKK